MMMTMPWMWMLQTTRPLSFSNCCCASAMKPTPSRETNPALASAAFAAAVAVVFAVQDNRVVFAHSWRRAAGGWGGRLVMKREGGRWKSEVDWRCYDEWVQHDGAGM